MAGCSSAMIYKRAFFVAYVANGSNQFPSLMLLVHSEQARDQHGRAQRTVIASARRPAPTLHRPRALAHPTLHRKRRQCFDYNVGGWRVAARHEH